VRRDPDRTNGAIAKACRSSIPAVAAARQSLGISPHSHSPSSNP
jgi:hypothetical protein